MNFVTAAVSKMMMFLQSQYHVSIVTLVSLSIFHAGHAGRWSADVTEKELRTARL